MLAAENQRRGCECRSAMASLTSETVHLLHRHVIGDPCRMQERFSTPPLEVDIRCWSIVDKLQGQKAPSMAEQLRLFVSVKSMRHQACHVGI